MIESVFSGDSVNIEIAVKVDPSTAGTITNTVEVKGDQFDPHPDNDIDSEATLITPVCTLDLTLSFAEGTLTIHRVLGTPEQANWSVWLFIPNTGFIQLWSVSLPVVPTVSFPFPIPGFPPLGTVGIVTALTGPGGVMCFDVEFIDTGTPSTANPTLEGLRELIPNNSIALPGIRNSN